jgi:Flp pilus assembly protein TadD
MPSFFNESLGTQLADPHRATTSESRTLYILALEKIKRSNHKEALVHLAEALRIAPTNPFYRSYFGYCLALVQRDFDRAVHFCQQASDSRPFDADLHVNLGRVYRLKGDRAAAYQAFTQAWHLSKGHAAAAAELARMGVRRPPVVTILSRGHWLNRWLGRVRAKLERKFPRRRKY